MVLPVSLFQLLACLFSLSGANRPPGQPAHAWARAMRYFALYRCSFESRATGKVRTKLLTRRKFSPHSVESV
jgi:hypothetical protein